MKNFFITNSNVKSKSNAKSTNINPFIAEIAVLILLQSRSTEMARTRLHFVMPFAYVRSAFNECTFPKRAVQKPRAATCCNRVVEPNAGIFWFIKRVGTAAPSAL